MNAQETNKLSTSFLQGCPLLFRVFIITITFLPLTSCIFSQNIAPTSDLSRKYTTKASKPSRHIVKRGETLFAIAWRYDMDYRQLASANTVGSDFLIYPGQTLNLSTNNKTHTTARSSTVPVTLSNGVALPTTRLKVITPKPKNVPRKVVKKHLQLNLEFSGQKKNHPVLDQ